jgi:hypothetical protein
MDYSKITEQEQYQIDIAARDARGRKIAALARNLNLNAVVSGALRCARSWE